MNRHPFRWEALAFGLLFLAVVGTWAAWESGVLASDQLAYAPAGTLIVLGVAGIIATFSRPRVKHPEATNAEAVTTTDEESHDGEATDPQS
jgi:hypothetical protein